jgi:imidazolonepropionase-like amidohydrolase
MKKLNSIPPVLKSLVVVTALFGLVASATAQQPAELVIQNGLVVTAVGRTETDLRIQNGVIAEMGRNLTAGAGARVIDARGMLVLPGGVDPHVHLTPTRTPTTANP